MLQDYRTVLVTGGAGYIGSHVVWALHDAGVPTVVIDDLSTGRVDALPSGVPLVEGSLADGGLIRRILREHGVGAVMHFAGSIVVPESVRRPLDYYANNTVNSHGLITASVEAGVRAFIFSSTAAVYGAAGSEPVDEAAPVAPINSYGRSKLMTELMLADAGTAHGLPFAILRYFNVAGADPGLRTGQSSPGATHLLKVACQAALGLRPHLDLFGEDYPTPDGTCIRDYIHVSDLAEAHVLALQHLWQSGESVTLNCGYGCGFSVRQVVAAVERAAGRPLAIRRADRRPGDPPALVAANGRIRRVLGWTPRHDDLGRIVGTALAWERKLAAVPAAGR
ncbi:UDP-glucose 4-epimerase GalE [Arenibaculum sp.]|jgi:UDP-glucose 4-epimerase|uniref:UDP-glucose 4-epimerase GalE n=1 Tax=Arenibaculum sp. TaxID=2865862 RepID=UPI002E0F4016|nr:UDP-glucose 4-epimerase GalE [Arenibaculum sp.]